MTTNYRTPGVYVEEVSTLPASVVPVETAIPAFFGYTEHTQSQGQSLIDNPVEISSVLEFEQIFGRSPLIGGFVVNVDPDGAIIDGVPDPNTLPTARFRLAHAIRHFYDNGGGRCCVVSLGDYSSSDLRGSRGPRASCSGARAATQRAGRARRATASGSSAGSTTRSGGIATLRWLPTWASP